MQWFKYIYLIQIAHIHLFIYAYDIFGLSITQVPSKINYKIKYLTSKQ